MYKPSTQLVITYFPTYLPTYIWELFPTQLVTKVKPNINPVWGSSTTEYITGIQWMVRWWVLVHRGHIKVHDSVCS